MRDEDQVTPNASVEVTTLDDVLFGAESDPRVEVLKIDAEGADALVLQGAERLLRERRVNHVFFERDVAHQKRFGMSRNEPQVILSGFGYKARRISRFVWAAYPKT